MPNLKMKPRTAAGVAAACCLLATLAACALPGSEPLEVTRGTVIRNARVVNTRTGAISPGMAVVIEDGKIRKITATAAVRASGFAQVVEADGKYLVPGYLDMHTHAVADAGRQPPPWPLMIANGITGFREMSGSAALLQGARQLNAEAAAGRVDAPEVLVATSDFFVGPITPPQAIQKVRQHKAMGADFIKILSVGRDTALATLAEAKNQGLPVAGHLTLGLSAVDSVNAGWRTIEHFGAGLGIQLDCAKEEAAVRQALLRGEGAKVLPSPEATVSPYAGRALDAPFYQRVMDSYSPEKCQQVVQTFNTQGTWQVPTLWRLRTMLVSNDPAFDTSPDLQYVEKTRRALWQKLATQYGQNTPAAGQLTFKQYCTFQKNFVALVKGDARRLLAGSDTGGIWVIPGFGLHQEFRELAEAGLTPLQVLQMTTLNGAVFLQREASMGTVEEGKNADLVLLDANPLENVANLSRISAVFLKGKHFSSQALAQLKADVADTYRRQPLQDVRAVLDLSHLD